MSFISVVMPVFNADKYIKYALDSMINQTYRNLQIVVVDEGSTDHTAEILHQYQKIDSRIEILHLSSGRGAMSQGVEYAAGDYLAHMDAADISAIHRLEIQLAFIKRNALDLCGSAVSTFYKGVQLRRDYPQTENGIRTQMLFSSPFASSSVMAKSGVLKNNNYPVNHTAADDYLFWTRLARKEYRFANHSEALHKFRLYKTKFDADRSQQLKRYLVAKEHWQSLGMYLPAKNISHFNSAFELKEIMRELSAAKLSFLDKKTLDSALWEMAVRSEFAGLEIYHQLLRSGVKLSRKKKAGLYFLLLCRKIFPALVIEPSEMIRSDF
ncbi:MAG: glycosyltransferase family 2 protein [Iodobacter sp.]